MKNSKKSKIEVVIMNPECIPAAQKKMAKFIYEEYIKKALEEAASGAIHNDVK